MARPPTRAPNLRRTRPPRRAVVVLALFLVIGGYLTLNGCRKEEEVRSAEAYCRQITAVVDFERSLSELDAQAVGLAMTATSASVAQRIAIPRSQGVIGWRTAKKLVT